MGEKVYVFGKDMELVKSSENLLNIMCLQKQKKKKDTKVSCCVKKKRKIKKKKKLKKCIMKVVVTNDQNEGRQAKKRSYA